MTVSAQQAETSGVPVLREEHPEPNNVLNDILQDKKGVCNRNWGNPNKNTTYTCGIYTKCITKTPATLFIEQSGPKEPAPATTEMSQTTKELQLRKLCNTTLFNSKHLLLPTTGMSSACPRTANHLGNCTAYITGDVEHMYRSS